MKKLLIPSLIVAVAIGVVTAYALRTKKAAPSPQGRTAAQLVSQLRGVQVSVSPFEEISVSLRPIAALAATTEARATTRAPLPCTDQASCEEYCKEHLEECVAFGKKEGQLVGEDPVKMDAFVALMERKETPGGCSSFAACETYCFEAGHMEECMQFASAQGLASSEDIELFRKTGGRGPGGCIGRQCEAYCNSPEHIEGCMTWATEQGFVTGGEVQAMREGMRSFKDHVANLPAEVVVCMKGAVGETVFAQIIAGEPVFSNDLNLTMQPCFASMMQGEQYGAPPGATVIPMGGRLPVDQFPEAVVACIEAAFGGEFVAGLKSGATSPTEGQGKTISDCFAALGSGSPPTAAP